VEKVSEQDPSDLAVKRHAQQQEGVGQALQEEQAQQWKRCQNKMNLTSLSNGMPSSRKVSARP
jgi:hypothetical protein